MASAVFFLRRGLPADARAILEAHRSAVRTTAATHYSQAIIDEWAPVHVAPGRVKTFEQWIERGEELIVVAVDSDETVVGFGSIVPSNSELRAVYVAAEQARKGVGRAILSQLETFAQEAGLSELRMDASMNAVAFYEANGFASLGRGEHAMSSGNLMPCMRMSKSLGRNSSAIAAGNSALLRSPEKL
jgi:putative acetyltransferase